MTVNSVVRARIDERTKRQAAAALKKIGLTVSDALRLLLVRVAADSPITIATAITSPRRSSIWGGPASKLWSALRMLMRSVVSLRR